MASDQLCQLADIPLAIGASMSSRFTGTDSYVATEDLMMAVNAAVDAGPAAAGEG